MNTQTMRRYISKTIDKTSTSNPLYLRSILSTLADEFSQISFVYEISGRPKVVETHVGATTDIRPRCNIATLIICCN